ncbi:MAG: 2-amino-4-hydroxy-6-hydroxymethyldihydropteridine diphosphokinase [Myxococcota bacterium]
MPRPAGRVAIGLGSSLGDRTGTLTLAVRQLAAHPQIALLRASHWVRTPPLAGGTARNWFANGVVLVDTTLSPQALLDRCVALEAEAGRRRGRRWMDRPLDLDLLLAEGLVVDTPRLVLPHPAIGRRRFVLEPLLEVWPDAVDPASGQAYAALPRAPGPAPVPIGMLGPRWPLRYL